MSKSLQGSVFHIYGLGLQKAQDIEKQIKSQGGRTSLVFGHNTTHLLTTPDIIKENGYLIRSAKKSKCKIVDCENLETFGISSQNDQNASTLSSSTGSLTNFLRPSSPSRSSNGKTSKKKKKSKKREMTVYNPNKYTSSGPTITLVVPNRGTISGTYKIAVFGLNFRPSRHFHIAFGKYICEEIEYHCPTALVATLRLSNSSSVPPGQVQVMASSNGGNHYGPSVRFTFYDDRVSIKHTRVPEESAEFLQAQLEQLRRSITQLQIGMSNVQDLESKIARGIGSFGADIDWRSFKMPQDSGETKAITGSDRVTGGSDVTPSTSHAVRDHKKQNIVTTSAKDDNEREIRIFISSPFKDMQAEREIIVKRVIPKLRKLCGERDVVLSYVDLRWGVTESQTENAASLLMCLRELSRCNVFVGLYGERYGWCLSQQAYQRPNKLDETLLRSFQMAAKEFPWLSEYKDRSITEIEMNFILHNKYSGDDKAAWFYLRDPYYIEGIDSKEKNLYLSEGEYEMGKLNDLKQRIESGPFPSVVYNRPTHLSELVQEDLLDYINRRFPRGIEMDPLKKERFRHTCYARNLTRTYLPKESCFMELDKFASTNTTRPIAVIGESGLGKSALLANWALRYSEHHPEDLVIEHYIGCSPTSSNHYHLLLRIMEELQDRLSDTTRDIPSNVSELVNIFPTWLERTLTRNKRKRLVIILDGLDSLDNTENSQNLLWLPQNFPPSIRLVLSMSPGSSPYQAVEEREWDELELNPLEEAERISFIRQYLNLNSKKLNEKQEFKIAKNPQTSNPRYLKTLLEDISVWGTFEELDKRIDRDLRANNASELYEVVLERLERDFEKDHKGMVEQFMMYIWGSRRGLSLETELAPLLEKKGIEAHEWSSLYLVIEQLLYNSGGVLDFSNRDIRQAVKTRYLPGPSKRITVHKELADFFQKSTEGFGERKVEELGWQLERAHEFSSLRDVISDLNMFIKLYTPKYKFDLFRFWRSIEKNSSIDVVDSYFSALNRSESFPADVIRGDVFFKVGQFLEDFAKYEGAQEAYSKARYQYETSSQSMDVAKCDYSIGRILISMAKWQEAEKTLLSTLAIYKREKGDNCMEVSHVRNRLGSLYTEMNEWKKAEKNLTEALRIRKEREGENGGRVGQTYKHLITYYENVGNLEKALEAGERALNIVKTNYGPEDFQVASILVRVGRIYVNQQKWDIAKSTLKKALKISIEKMGENHPYTADIKYELGCFFFQRPEVIARVSNESIKKKLANKDFWLKKEWNKVDLVEAKKKKESSGNKRAFSLDKAENWFMEALAAKIDAVGRDHPDTARILCRLGSLYIERTEFERAEEALQEALSTRLKFLGPTHSRVAQIYKHLLTLYQSQERFKEAKDSGFQALSIIERMYGKQSVAAANVWIRIGEVAEQEGNLDDAKEYYRKTLDIRTQLLGPDHKSTKSIETMLDHLRIPPPPPPPPPSLIYDMESMRQQAAPEVSTKARKAIGRMDLIAEIENFGKKKKSLHRAKPQVMAKNLQSRQGWWKQGYNYAGGGKVHVNTEKKKEMMNKPSIFSKVQPLKKGKMRKKRMNKK